jgi:hypothetical protein
MTFNKPWNIQTSQSHEPAALPDKKSSLSEFYGFATSVDSISYSFANILRSMNYSFEQLSQVKNFLTVFPLVRNRTRLFSEKRIVISMIFTLLVIICLDSRRRRELFRARLQKLIQKLLQNEPKKVNLQVSNSSDKEDNASR